MQMGVAAVLVIFAFSCFFEHLLPQPITSASLSPNGTQLFPWRDGDTSGKTALAHQTAFRFGVSSASSRGKQGRLGNIPPSPQSRPTANLHRSGGSPTCSPPTQVPQLLLGGKIRIEVVLGNPWRCAGWLWAWLEQQPSPPKSDNAACRSDNEMNKAVSFKCQKSNSKPF